MLFLDNNNGATAEVVKGTELTFNICKIIWIKKPCRARLFVLKINLFTYSFYIMLWRYYCFIEYIFNFLISLKSYN